ncbi:MAG: hypothetical protein QM617_09090 [Comamonas sp.]
MTKKNEVAVAQPVAAPVAAVSAERDLANQLLGQIQMSRAISRFTDVVSLQKLKYIKENKSYRALSGQKGYDRDGQEITDVGTFDGFCRALGTSASKVDEDLKNLQVFGEEALAQLTQAGAGYRELRQYRRLPEDEQKALVEVAATGDKEAFLELAETIIAKNAKDKAELRQELADLEKTKTNLAVDLEKAEAERDGLAKQLKRRRLDEEDGDGVPVVVADIRAEIAALVKKAELSLSSLYGIGVEVVQLAGSAEAHPWREPTLRLGLSGLLALREQLDGNIKAYATALGEGPKRLLDKPEALAFLEASEIKTVAEEWAALVATHQHEEALRKHERDQAKPKGRGRPKNAPAPKAGE